MRRDDFLKLCSLAGLGIAVPRSLRSETKDTPPYEGPFYAVFNASGGWDTTYLMDPKGVNEMNRLYKHDDILTHGAHKFAPTAKTKDGGMSNEDFYKEFGGELLVVNGLDYSINNHSPGARYMATGKLDSLAFPTFAALVAACRGASCPLAYLTFGNYSATGNLVAMSRVPYLPSLKRVALADHVEGNERAPYQEAFVLDHIEQALASQHEAMAAQPRLPRLDRAENMLYAAQVNSKALQRVVPFIPRDQPKARMAQQAEIALASFAAGVCVSANLSIGQFDSHQNNDRDQMKLIPEFLEGIACFIRRAEELKLRDKLVVIVQSEMGRTPNYNNGNGKDHWSIGSAMFLGPGIKGNRVIGATDDKLMCKTINAQTLALDDKGIRIRPEHVHESLRQLAGIDQHAFAKKFPLGMNPPELLKGLWG